MARGRILSRSLGASERFFDLHARLAPVGLGEFAGELYMLLIANSDDFGRLAGDAFTIKHTCYPISLRTLSEFDLALAGLHDAKLVVRYRYGPDETKLAIQIVQHEQHNGDLQSRRPSVYPVAPARLLAEVDALSDDVERVLNVCADVLAVSGDDLVPTETILAALGGKLSAVRLAAIFSKVSIYPVQSRIGAERVRGYDRGELSQAVTAVTSVTPETNRNETKGTEQKGHSLSSLRDSARADDTATEAVFTDDELMPIVEPKPKPSSRRAKPSAARESVDALVALYRECCPQLVAAGETTKTRSLAIAAALKREPNLEKWRIYFERLNRSSFCAGKSASGWVASLSFALKPETWVKTFEGQYDDRKPARGPIRTADDARAALRDRGVTTVTKNDIDIH